MQKELYGCGYSLAGTQFAGCNVLNVQRQQYVFRKVLSKQAMYMERAVCLKKVWCMEGTVRNAELVQ